MIVNFEVQKDRLAYPLEEAGHLCGVSKSKLRKDIASGKLVAKKNGSKVVILHTALMEYLEKELTDWTPMSERAAAA